MKIKIQSLIDYQKGVIELNETIHCVDAAEAARLGIEECLERVARLRVDTRDKSVRKCLIELGWTPPIDQTNPQTLRDKAERSLDAIKHCDLTETEEQSDKRLRTTLKRDWMYSDMLTVIKADIRINYKNTAHFGAL